jgi:amino acid transporter
MFPEDFDVSQRGDVQKLRRGAVGLGGVLFLTVTGAAPISAMMFNTPIVVGFGQGIGAPAAFLFATIVLAIFSVGYVAMARTKTTAGGFYSYISHGLGGNWASAPASARWSPTRCSEAPWLAGFAYF